MGRSFFLQYQKYLGTRNGIVLALLIQKYLSLCPISREHVSMRCSAVSTKIYNTGFAMTHTFTIIS